MTIPMVMRTVRCRMILPPPLYGSLKRRKPNNERDQRIVTAVTNGADLRAGSGRPGAGGIQPVGRSRVGEVPPEAEPQPGVFTDPVDPVYGVPGAAGPWRGSKGATPLLPRSFTL